MDIKIIDKKIIIKFKYDKAKVNKIRKIPDRVWDEEHKAWIIPYVNKSIKKLIEFFNDEDINWSKIFKFTIINLSSLYVIDIGKECNKMYKELTLKGYSEKTKKSYIGHLK